MRVRLIVSFGVVLTLLLLALLPGVAASSKGTRSVDARMPAASGAVP